MLHFRMDMPFYFMMLYGSIMILVVLLLRALLKNTLPKFVFPVLWALILLRLLVPFSLSSPLSLKLPDISLPSFNIAYTEATAGTAVESLPDEKIIETTVVRDILSGVSEQETIHLYAANDVQIHWNWRIMLPVVYFLGIAATAGILFWQKLSYSKKLKNSLLIEQNETINTLLRAMDMGQILVFTNDEIASPLVCGLLAPRIYLPTRMDFQNTELLRHILSHETMHIRRKDNWVKTIMLIALCLNWFNPLVWLMSKCLSSDLETACDAAVLAQYDEEQRKSYALSLLAMAITGNRHTLLYSAFSKTEVEKRIKNIVHYKKASVFVLMVSFLLLTSSTVAFATAGQAPFYSYLTSYCASSQCRWGVQAEITRDIALGENPQERAETIVFTILSEDTDNDPELIKQNLKAALAEEFGVEKEAFRIYISLFLTNEKRDAEYSEWDIIHDKDNFYLYQGEKVRTFQDKLAGVYQSREEGTVDLSIQRNRLGIITAITAQRQGDSEFDSHSKEIEQNRQRHFYSGAVAGTDTAVFTPDIAEQSQVIEGP